MIVVKTAGSGISGAVRYVMGEGKRDPATGRVPELVPGESSRVAWYGGTGFGFPIDSEERLDIARRVMEWAAHTQASRTKKCTEDCLHLVLSWDIGEQPGRSEMEVAAHSLLKAAGMEKARAIFACHDDTDHAHLHLVVSRINPENGKAFPNSFDTLAFSQWALQWERDHGGVRCEARLDREFARGEADPEKVLAAFITRRETFTAFDLNRELTAALPHRDMRRSFINQVLARPEMVRLADPGSGQVLRYTTRQTLAAEQIAEELAGRLHARAHHAVSNRAMERVVADLKSDSRVLRRDQVEALAHAVGPEGLAVIAGKAGTGKTFAMSVIADAYREQGYAVQSLAPSNKVAAALRRDGLEASTLHSMVGRLDRGQAVWNAQTLVMVDEAGMVSTRMMARLLSHAEHAGAKVILVGDEKQLTSIDRGGMYGFLADQHGYAAMDEIVRQRSAAQRELARRASQYDFDAALTSLDRQGGLIRVSNSEDRISRAAALWAERSRLSPDASLFVVTVSNADAHAANLAIRTIRRRRGELGADQRVVTADGTQAFAVGDRILFSGSAYSVEDRARGLVNGNAGVIVGIDGRRMSVALDGARPGEVLSFTIGSNREAGEFNALRLGYAGTIYKAQGATYDHTIVIDHPGMRASSGYVALTRHRDSVAVVTDQHGGDVAAMAERWRRIDDRRAASRFEALDYEPPVMQRWSPAEVRAAVGLEAFEQAAGQGLGRLSPRSRVEEGRMELGPPDDNTLRQQLEREQFALQHLKALDEQAQALRAYEADRIRDQAERTQAFRQARDREAEEVRKNEAERRAADERKAREGDINGAEARYAIALGENYNVRDPYASLARAAMSESAMFHRSQQEMRADMAKESDPAKREIIELRRQIEGCEYMAVTSDRLAGISTAITGRAESGLDDKARAESYRQLAKELRQERSALIETQQAKEQATAQAQEAARLSEPAIPRPRATSAERQQLNALHEGAQQAKPEAAREAGAPSRQADEGTPTGSKATLKVRFRRGEATPRPMRSAAERQQLGAVLEVASQSVEPQRSEAASDRAQTPEAPAPRPRATPDQRQQLGALHEAARQPEPEPTRPSGPPQRAASVHAMAPGAQPAQAWSQAAQETDNVEQPKPQETGIQVYNEKTDRTVSLKDYVRDHPREPEAPRRPVDMKALLNDPDARRRAQQEQFDDIKRSREADKVVGRIGQDLKAGKPVKSEDLNMLNREQWDRVARRGDAGLREVVNESQQRAKDGKGFGREKEQER